MTRKTTSLEKEVFLFLNDLRESGITNMFGARPYIMEEFTLDKSEASYLLAQWMRNFNSEGEYEIIKA